MGVWEQWAGVTQPVTDCPRCSARPCPCLDSRPKKNQVQRSHQMTPRPRLSKRPLTTPQPAMMAPSHRPALQGAAPTVTRGTSVRSTTLTDLCRQQRRGVLSVTANWSSPCARLGSVNVTMYSVQRTDCRSSMAVRTTTRRWADWRHAQKWSIPRGTWAPRWNVSTRTRRGVNAAKDNVCVDCELLDSWGLLCNNFFPRSIRNTTGSASVEVFRRFCVGMCSKQFGRVWRRLASVRNRRGSTQCPTGCVPN